MSRAPEFMIDARFADLEDPLRRLDYQLTALQAFADHVALKDRVSERDISVLLGGIFEAAERARTAIEAFDAGFVR
jgi:hypothetical protein